MELKLNKQLDREIGSKIGAFDLVSEANSWKETTRGSICQRLEEVREIVILLARIQTSFHFSTKIGQPLAGPSGI